MKHKERKRNIFTSWMQVFKRWSCSSMVYIEYQQTEHVGLPRLKDSSSKISMTISNEGLFERSLLVHCSINLYMSNNNIFNWNWHTNTSKG